MGDSDRLRGAVATVVSIDTSDTIAAPPEAPRARPWRSHEPVQPDYDELPTIDPSHYVFATEIARGGMGRIAIARDLRLGREVAVKEIIAESDDLDRRFEREVRITARLQHPSIVSVHEAGRWPTGEPFYAMKLVSGRSLFDVIAGAPTLASRLASLPNVLAVADAIAYAHQQRVIHRDVKPHNVILGAFGETVVIDWGLAKQLDAVDMTTSSEQAPTGDATSAGAVLGTLAYMPPEQAAGDAVDERADVYAIGAILYHVLTGQPPFAAPSFAELLAMVHDETPRPIAASEPEAPADLIAIAERAMARDRHTRYPTAQELADDLRRFQTGQLVGAHRYSLRELLWRWIRRHRAVLAAAVIAIAVIAVGGTLAIRRIMASESRAEAQSLLATKNQAEAEQLTHFMLFDLHKRLRDLGRIDILDGAARRAADYYDAHDGTSDDDQADAAAAHEQIAEIMTSQGQRDLARQQMERAHALAGPLSARRPDFMAAAMVELDTAILVGRDQLARGDSESALASFHKAQDIAKGIRTRQPSARKGLFAVVKAASEIAAVFAARGDRDSALAADREALVAERELAVTPDPDTNRLAMTIHGHIGDMLLGKGDADAALAEFRTSLAIGEHASDLDRRSLQWMWQIASSHHDVGRALLAKGDVDGALAEFRTSLELNQRLVSIDPGDARWQHTLVVSHEAIGSILTTRHDLVGAMTEMQAAIAMNVALLRQDSADTSLRRNLSVMYNKIGDIEESEHDVVSAIASYRSGLELREALVKTDPTNAEWQRDLFYSHYRIASFLERLHLVAPTIAELRIARELAVAAATRTPDDRTAQIDLARVHAALGSYLFPAGDVDAACSEFEAAKAIAVRMGARPKPAAMWAQIEAAMTKNLAPCRANRAGASPRPPPPAP